MTEEPEAGSRNLEFGMGKEVFRSGGLEGGRETVGGERTPSAFPCRSQGLHLCRHRRRVSHKTRGALPGREVVRAVSPAPRRRRPAIAGGVFRVHRRMKQGFPPLSAAEDPISDRPNPAVKPRTREPGHRAAREL